MRASAEVDQRRSSADLILFLPLVSGLPLNTKTAAQISHR